MLKTELNLEIRYLEVKKQDAKYDWFVSSLKCNKQFAHIVCTGRNGSSKMQLIYLVILKH